MRLLMPLWTKLDSKNFREEVFDASWGTLIGEVEKDGRAKFTLDALDVGKKTIVSDKIFHDLAGINLRVSILIEDKDESRKPRILSKLNTREILKEWGGIFVFQNGFRIFPYGEDDWLDIERDRALSKGTSSIDQVNTFASTLKNINPTRFLLRLLSNRNYLGEVILPPDVKGFDLKTNRGRSS